MPQPLLVYPDNPPEIISYVTVFDSRHCQIETTAGVATYEDWLYAEARRVALAYPCAIVRRRRDRHIALALIKPPSTNP